MVLDLFSRRVVGWAMADHPGHQLALAALDDCRDNAPMESFYATLKGELVEQRDYLTRDEARADVFQFLEGRYNRRRLHSALGYLTPEQTVAAFMRLLQPRNTVRKGGGRPDGDAARTSDRPTASPVDRVAA